MNRETLFALLFVIFPVISAQDFLWLLVGNGKGIILPSTETFDFYTTLIAGRTYSIVAYGADGFDTTLTVTDPSGYSASNDNWGSTPHPLSSALDFVPTVSGRTVITAGANSGTGAYYIFILEKTSCIGTTCGDCRQASFDTEHCPICSSGYNCASCSTVRSQYGSACLLGCPEGTFKDSSSGACKHCSVDAGIYCSKCTSSTSCSACLTGYVFHQNKCLDKCPTGFYNNSGTCSACLSKTQGCSECVSATGSCTACSSTWYHYGSTCSTTCPDGSYANSSLNQCTACSTLHSDCTKCNSATNCLECSGNKLREGKNCVESCSGGYFQNNDKCRSCSQLHASCISCNSSTQCTGCSSGVAFGAGCIPACGAGTFHENGICQPCAKKTEGCSACVPSTGICSSCVSGWYLYSNLCYQTCPSGSYPIGNTCVSCSSLDPGCTKCDSSTNCLECSGGFPEGNQCVLSCSTTYFKNSNNICTPCSQLHTSCNKCSSSTQCTRCTLASGLVASGASCVSSCDSGFWKDNGACQPCSTKTQGCIACYENGGSCTSCASGWYYYSSTCETACLNGLYPDGNKCSECSNAMYYCSKCDSATNCQGCSGGNLLEDSRCVSTCKAGNFKNNDVCSSCSLVDSNCIECSSSILCDKCSAGYYSDPMNGCQSCLTLNLNCFACSSPTSCDGCYSPYYSYGNRCESTCPIGTYADDEARKCLPCSTTLNSYCTSCVNNRSCTACSNNRFAYGSTCITSCPQGTANNGGICTAVSLKVSLSNTENANQYLVQITSALVYDVQVPIVSKVILVGVDPSVYKYTLTKQSDTIYLISIQNTQSISSTALRFVYSLTDTPSTKNINIGEWTDQIPSKYMAYISEGAKKAAEAISSVAGGTMQGASVGAGSMALLGGNPALLWTLMNLFQAFYYLSFIDVNYPANVQMFFEIFSMGSLSFIPNPLEWFVKDIEEYNLPVPQRYNDQDFSGLFLDNAGNELLMLSFVFIIFCICKMMKKWVRRLPTSLRFASEKTIGWFQWSGVLESLTTSYTDIAQAVFLQLKILTFSSTVFSLSSVLCIVTLGYVVAFPILIIMIIRKFSDHPELLTIQYETLVKDYNLDKVSARNFVPIWLIRRLIMCVSLVFLQGYPYVQITLLSMLQIAGIYYCWVYTPYTTKKENICNTLIEILFGFIHVVIYILVYDDHNPYFSEEQRLQLGWTIVFFCGAILIISLGVSIYEQVRMMIRGFRMLKQLMFKKEKIKMKVNKEDRLKSSKMELSTTTLADQSTLVELNRTQGIETLSLTSPNMRAAARASPPPRNMVLEKKLRRARLASKIRELRAINS